MRHKNLILLLVVISTLSETNAQTILPLTADRNAFRPGDLIIKQQVEFKDPGPSGKNIAWDFSMLNPVNEKYKIKYQLKTKSDSTQLVANEHETKYRYHLKNDTLWLSEYENRTTRMKFEQPEAQLKFPFNYGDSLFSVFSGTGIYCEKVDLIAQGKTYVTIDATGELTTPTKVTLKNVIRVHRLRDYTEIGVDSALLRFESYSWYATGYRYPVFETYISSIVKKDTIEDDFKTSFYYPVEDMVNLAADPANENLKYEETNDLYSVFTEATYMPNPVVDNLQISFKLIRPATVWFSLHNNAGIPMKQTTAMELPSGANSTNINMSNLMTGTYTLYVHVDDKVMKQVIIKK